MYSRWTAWFLKLYNCIQKHFFILFRIPKSYAISCKYITNFFRRLLTLNGWKLFMLLCTYIIQTKEIEYRSSFHKTLHIDPFLKRQIHDILWITDWSHLVLCQCYCMKYLTICIAYGLKIYTLSTLIVSSRKIKFEKQLK